ncbi:hypothetical protein GF326_10010 [Candidatus Bathyarchaeota archaeon]|nr:hypothetical protein [Candidatus Bathyarchaeota archaeon]
MDEIPLDVCKLCIDAWKTSAEIQSLTGTDMLTPTIMTQSGPQSLQIMQSRSPRKPERPSREPRSEPITFTPSIDEETEVQETQELLSKLDNDFILDKITAEEYVQRRREIVTQLTEQIDTKKPSLLAKATQDGFLSPEDSFPAGPPEDKFEVTNLENKLIQQSDEKTLPLILLERKLGKINVTKYPRNWKLPEGYNSKNLDSIYDLYEDLRENQEKILIRFNGTKIAVLGKKKNKILCMVLEKDSKIEDYRTQINKLLDKLETRRDYEELIKSLEEGDREKKDLSLLDKIN